MTPVTGRVRLQSRSVLVLAALLMVLVGVRRELVGSMATADCVALAALPMTWPTVRRQRLFSPLLVTAVLAALTGLALSWLADPDFSVMASAQRNIILSLLGVPASAAAFVWAAQRLGTRGAALALSSGMVLDSMRLLGSSPNPWKFGVGAAVSLVVLVAADRYGRLVQLAALAALAATFLVSDARSSLAFLAITAGIVCWQAVAAWMRWQPAQPRRLALTQVLALAAVGATAVLGVLLASSTGSLGEDAQERTVAQASGPAGFLLAARPELGGSWALFLSRPWGYGAGVMPRYEDVRVAKEGMAALGYDPANGYVENFMFGNGFELHSGLADVWIAGSLPGAALVLTVLWLTLLAMVRDLGSLRVTPWLCVASLVIVQNVLVGPWAVLPAYLPLVLGSAMVQAPLGGSGTGTPSRHPDSALLVRS
ncbi:hypothetical protein [Actinomyces sp. 2119]|uniref:hypothetical protein n=1 Tax=Actinomyces sp. 2119 TaxID=2321393 RepID=UPI0011C41717|nr:hypothetical protein [Actinomyces sp. 2119]